MHAYMPTMEQKKQIGEQENEQGDLAAQQRQQEREMHARLDKQLHDGLMDLENRITDEKRLVRNNFE